MSALLAVQNSASGAVSVAAPAAASQPAQNEVSQSTSFGAIASQVLNQPHVAFRNRLVAAIPFGSEQLCGATIPENATLEQMHGIVKAELVALKNQIETLMSLPIPRSNVLLGVLPGVAVQLYQQLAKLSARMHAIQQRFAEVEAFVHHHRAAAPATPLAAIAVLPPAPRSVSKDPSAPNA